MQLPAADEVEAHLAAASLREFIELAWPVIEPGTTFKPGRHIDAICTALEHVTNGECKRLIVNVPPRHMKSLIISVAWPAWVWLKRPETRFLCASYAQNLALQDSVKCRLIIESEGGQEVGGLVERVGYRGLLALLERDWRLTSDQNEKRQFTNSQRGYRAATSVGGTVTGMGGDVIILDDPNNADDAHSEAARKSVRDWLDGTLSTRLNDPETGAIVVVQQRVHQEDATGHLVEQGIWEHVCLPAEYEPDHPHHWDGDWREEPGELLWPEHYGPGPIADLKMRMPPAVRPGQLQQRPTAAEGGMFKRDWWTNRWSPETNVHGKYVWEDQMPGSWDSVIQSWDMRFTDNKQSGDWVVGQLWGFKGANAYLLAQIRGRLSFTESQQAIRDLTAWNEAQPMGPFRRCRAKLVEKKANGDAIIQTLRDEVGGIIPIVPSESKMARAAAVTPLVEAGNVILPGLPLIPCPPGYEPTPVDVFVEEHAGFPLGSHDDQVDAFTQALNWRRPKDPGPPPVKPGRAAKPLAAGVKSRAL